MIAQFSFRIRVAAFGFVGVCFLLAGIASATVVTPAERIPKLLEQLGSADPVEAQAAEIGLAFLLPDDFAKLQQIAAKGTVKAPADARLKAFIARQLPYQAPRKRVMDARAALANWRKPMALAAYEKAGFADPKWDADARAAIAGFTGPLMDAEASHSAATKAIKAGCLDPYIEYIDIRAVEALNLGSSSSETKFRESLDRTTASQYPAIIKMQCYVGIGKTTHGRNFGRLKAAAKSPRELALEIWPAVFKEHVPGETLEKVADRLTQSDLPATRKETFDAICAPWQQADPDNVDLLTYQGKFYIQYAWDVRGDGFANTVTEEGGKLFAQRLATAEQLLTKAWEKDHNATEAATAMLTVELGQGRGRDRMELWFKRAMEADPDNAPACYSKMRYLEPKWYGQAADMITFGHECFASQNWRSGIPLQLAYAYQTLLGYLEDPAPLMTAPPVWKDIEALHAPYLKTVPDDLDVRYRYAYFACLAQKWDVVRQQFDALGPQINPYLFGGAAKLEEYRALAREKGGQGH